MQFSDQSVTASPWGRTLQGRHYCLVEQQGEQRWSESTREVWWLAQDMEAGGRLHRTICEVVLGDSGSIFQKMLQPAIRALLSVSVHPFIPGLLDVFQEEGHGFFVFERPGGESLKAYMQRRGGALPETEVIACCLQIVEILLHLSKHSPPIVHGLISPENIVAAQLDSGHFRWVLTNFSPIVASGAAPSLTSREDMFLYPSEGIRNGFTIQTDLYALLTAAYYAVTGLMPPRREGLVPVQQINPAISTHFAQILAKGIAPVAHTRFQQPSELYQALGGSSAPVLRPRLGQNRTTQIVPSSLRPSIPSERPTFPSVEASLSGREASTEGNVPSIQFPVETLSPPSGSNDVRIAVWWIIGTLLCQAILLLAARWGQ
jgi:serine/threonine protein kinase